MSRSKGIPQQSLSVVPRYQLWSFCPLCLLTPAYTSSQKYLYYMKGAKLIKCLFHSQCSSAALATGQWHCYVAWFRDETQPVESECWHSLNGLMRWCLTKEPHITLNAAAYSEKALCCDRLATPVGKRKTILSHKCIECLWFHWAWV